MTTAPPYSFIPFLERAYRQGIPVIVICQHPPSPKEQVKYTPAQAFIKAGAIHIGNMTMAAAVAKFRWVLSIAHRRKDWKHMTPKRKRELVLKLMIGESFVGEF